MFDPTQKHAADIGLTEWKLYDTDMFCYQHTYYPVADPGFANGGGGARSVQREDRLKDVGRGQQECGVWGGVSPSPHPPQRIYTPC